MILLTHQAKSVRKIIAFALLMYFALSSFVGAAESVICIGQEETHIVKQNQSYFGSCHGLSKIDHSQHNLYFDSDETHEHSCVDISLCSYGPSILSQTLLQFAPQELPHFAASSLPLNDVTSLLGDTAHLLQYLSKQQLISLSTIVLII